MAEMGSRAKNARNLASFGVAGLLAGSAKIFYENVFSSRHLGRVSDLLSARLRESGIDELVLRTVLLHGIFESCQATSGGSQPILLECGLDESSLALSLSFDRGGRIAEADLQLWAERARGEPNPVEVPGGVPADIRLVGWIRQWSRLATVVIVRGQADRGKIEIAAVIPLKAAPGQAGTIETVWIDSSSEAAPEVESYTELGDLDYTQLLASDSPKRMLAASPTGQFLVKSLQPESSSDPGSEVIRVKGSSAHAADVPGYGAGAGPGKVEGGADEVSASHPAVRRYIEKIAELQARIQDLEAAEDSSLQASVLKESKLMESGAAATPLAGPASSSESRAIGDVQAETRIQKVLRKVWPFRRRSAELPVSNEVPQTHEAKAVPSSRSEPVDTGPQEVDKSDLAAHTLLSEIESGGLSHAISRFEKESATVKAELGNSKAQKLLDGMMAELLGEKARLNEMAKQVSLAIRQKDLEMRQRDAQFRNKETAFLADARNQERVLRHKDYSMSRMKEMLAKSTIAIERLKAQAAGGVAGTPKPKAGASAAEVSALKLSLERAQRQVEEMKKSKEQIAERLADIQKNRESNVASVGELKTRLDASMKMLTLGKKQSDRLTAQVETMRRE